MASMGDTGREGAAVRRAPAPVVGEGRPCALAASVKRREAWAFLGYRGQPVDDRLAAIAEELSLIHI